MRRKVLEKAYAIGLRKKGWSYNEILKKVPASKSTLSEWLRDTPLSEDERRLLRDHTGESRSRGKLKAAAALRAKREERDRELMSEMHRMYDSHKAEGLFQVGLALYWAEGSKGGGAFMLANSDSDLSNIMLDWLERYFGLPRTSIKVRLYTHKPFAHERHEERWARELNVPLENFQRTVFKPTGKLVKKRQDYKGCLRIEVTKGVPGRKMLFLTKLFLDDYRKDSTVYGMRL